jgi:putative transcriptional regulator
MTGFDVKKLRIKLGLTQEQLAQLLGVSWITVNRWERNKCNPSPLAAEKLQTLFNRIEEAGIDELKRTIIK